MIQHQKRSYGWVSQHPELGAEQGLKLNIHNELVKATRKYQQMEKLKYKYCK